MTTNGRSTTNGRPITPTDRNVLVRSLAVSGTDPLTGFYRTGCCDTGPDDLGVHAIVRREDLLRYAVDVAGGAV